MTVDSNSLTMADAALQSNSPLVQAVTWSLLDNGSVLARDIPFVNKKTMLQNGVRFVGNLPTPNWAKINAEPVAGKATPTPYQEVAYIIRDSVDVDKVLVEDENQISDPREIQTQAHLKAIAYDFNDKFINNNHVSGNADAPVGLRYRLDNYTTYGLASTTKIDASVDMRLATLTAASTKDAGNSFLEKLDQLLWAVDAADGSPDVVLYMNDVMKRRMRTALRALGTDGGFSTAQDQFGRNVDTYKGAKVVDIGYKADQSTRIITTTEDTSGVDASSTYTSIYAVNYGPGHFYGWQFDPLMARDLGLMNNGVIYRTVIDWAGGLMYDNIRSVGRLYDIRLA
jgi:hypothetical protein